MASAPQPDLITVILDDHREVEQAFAELESKSGTPVHRRNLADHVIAAGRPRLVKP